MEGSLPPQTTLGGTLRRGNASTSLRVLFFSLSILIITWRCHSVTSCTVLHCADSSLWLLSLASPRQCINLFFDDKYSIEPSWECKFDHIEIRDGPFSFSPIIGRYCGQESPMFVVSTGRYLWIKFVADSELESTGFSATYNFTQGKAAQGTWK